MYCLNLMAIALELARRGFGLRRRGQQVLGALPVHRQRHESPGRGRRGHVGRRGRLLLRRACTCPTALTCRLKVRSMVGLIPLFAVETLEPTAAGAAFPASTAAWSGSSPTGRDLTHNVASMAVPGRGERRLLSLVVPDAAAPHSERACWTKTSSSRPSASAAFRASTRTTPTCLPPTGRTTRVDYEPANRSTGLFGGNSNWRGPVWFPLNYLLIESLQKFHHYLGDDYQVECPTRLGQQMTCGKWRRRFRAACRGCS